MSEDEVEYWSPESHINHACQLAIRAEAAYGETGMVLALIGQLHVQIAFAKSELSDD